MAEDILSKKVNQLPGLIKTTERSYNIKKLKSIVKARFNNYVI
ncbi:9437_t:CDS:2 [Ambispora leptoticha]|uniref:9437_t:CDS:1 n=1 Tax=Ambispora leptoticha TaxID=144679 RepID=A0A9N9B6Q0_9GLOM|nr:9437_t:CDS:2 [Ambispora leptoticha]